MRTEKLHHNSCFIAIDIREDSRVITFMSELLFHSYRKESVSK